MPILGPPGALSPRDWHALVDYDAWRDFYTPDDGVALHHGGGFDYGAGSPPFSQADEIQQLQQWEGFHIYGRGWRGLAYGWAVGQSGTIYRIRGWASYGAHTGDVDGDGISNNSEIIPIIFIGSGNHHVLSPAAQDAIERLRRFIEAQAPAAQFLYGHTELRGTVTECPGPHGMAYVKANRRLETDMKPPSWAIDATQWHINRNIYTQASPDDVDESVEFHRQTVFRHRFYSAIRDEIGQGEKGDKGDRGPKGDKGDPGADGALTIRGSKEI